LTDCPQVFERLLLSFFALFLFWLFWLFVLAKDFTSVDWAASLAVMFRRHVSPSCFAVMFRRHVSQSCFAVMFRARVASSAAISAARVVLPRRRRLCAIARISA
jgi:hypothetical protein